MADGRDPSRQTRPARTIEGTGSLRQLACAAANIEENDAMHGDTRSISVDRFEIAFAEDGDAMVCFVGRASVEDGAPARLSAGALTVERGALPSLTFRGILPRDLARLAAAPAIYVTRSFDLRDHEIRRVHLAA